MADMLVRLGQEEVGLARPAPAEAKAKMVATAARAPPVAAAATQRRVRQDCPASVGPILSAASSFPAAGPGEEAVVAEAVVAAAPAVVDRAAAEAVVAAARMFNSAAPADMAATLDGPAMVAAAGTALPAVSAASGAPVAALLN
jgi:hypothetical protein